MMRKISILVPLLILPFVLSCSLDQMTQPEQIQDQAAGDQTEVFDPELVAVDLIQAIEWEFSNDVELPDRSHSAEGIADAHGCVIDFEREVIMDDIAHYKFIVRIGHGPFDRIGIHRVVKESSPYRPIHTSKSIFLQHGDLQGFEGVFLFGSVSPVLPDDYSLAFHLAEAEVDVWGIDQNWVLVPEDTADLSFMADWGLQNQIDNLRKGLALARFCRLLTGSGRDKMNLLGYSSGSWVGYAYLNQESQRPLPRRHVKGYIPVDSEFKTDNEDNRLVFCETAAFFQDLLDSGIYGDDLGAFLRYMAELARTAPDDPSPIDGFEGLTNLQAALIMGTSPFPPPPWFHYLAGQFDDDGLPFDLTATRVDAWLDFMSNMAPYEPIRFEAEFWSVTCDEVEVPWDDHLADITVPVFYIGAVGGEGEFGIYSTTLLGSTDVTSLVVGLTPPPGDPFLEFGHIDLFTADLVPNDTRSLTWGSILDWIDTHDDRGGKMAPVLSRY